MKARIALAALLALIAGLSTGQPTASVETQRADAWQIRCLECPHWIEEMTDRSIGLDDQGHPHLAYGGDHLYYASHDGVAWQVETVDDSPAVGSSASLALDESGQPRIAYYDSVNKALKFAAHDLSGWTTETVDTGGDGGDVGANAMLALDAAGRPHIVYSDSSNSGLKYAYFGANGWRVESVADADFQGTSLSMAVSSVGVPHISYFDHTQDALIYGQRAASGWVLETVIPNDGTTCSLVLDENDRPHIAYYAYIGAGESGIAHQTETSWQFEELHWNLARPSGLALTVSDAGFFHVSATVWVLDNAGYPGLRYMLQDENGWHLFAGIDDDGVQLGQTTLALGGDGRSSIGFPTRDGISLATFDGTDWATAPVDTSDDAGSLSSLAIDSTGRPIVAYSRQGSSMCVASWNGGYWGIEACFPSSSSQRRAGFSLVLDADNQPHVIHAWEHRYADVGYYYDLTYRYRDPSGWQSRVIAENTSGGPFESPSLALDGDGGIHVGYTYGSDGLILRYAPDALSNWTYEQADTDAWRLGTLALAANGDPLLAYETKVDLVKVAFEDAAGWHYEIVDTAGGSGVSMVLGADGYPRVSYGAYAGGLGFAYRDATGWHRETVLPGEFDDTLLELDAAGYAHISAYDAATGDLVYAHQDAAGWHTQTIDTGGPTGDVGKGSSLALHPDGWVYITYYDQHNRDLLLATNHPPTVVTLTQLYATSGSASAWDWQFGIAALLGLLIAGGIAALAGWRFGNDHNGGLGP